MTERSGENLPLYREAESTGSRITFRAPVRREGFVTLFFGGLALLPSSVYILADNSFRLMVREGTPLILIASAVGLYLIGRAIRLLWVHRSMVVDVDEKTLLLRRATPLKKETLTISFGDIMTLSVKDAGEPSVMHGRQFELLLRLREGDQLGLGMGYEGDAKDLGRRLSHLADVQLVFGPQVPTNPHGRIIGQ